MSVSIRQLGPQDAGAAELLVAKFHRHSVTDQYLAGLLTDARNLLLVAEDGDELVGFVWAHWLPRLKIERQQLFVYEIDVDQQYHRQGIGTMLMRAAISAAEAEGADAFVFTNRSNAKAVAFYKRLGGRIKNGDDLLFVYPAGASSADRS